MIRATPPPDCPRLIFNSDGDSTTCIAFEPPITPEQACRDIEEIAGTSVEVFTNSMGRGDETFSHTTGFGEVYGSNVDAAEWPQAEGLEYVRWMADSTRALLDRGVDIIELLAARAHERGMQFWPALRVNDMLYAAASSFWHQGASCIYLFNYDCHRLPKTGSDAYTPDDMSDCENVANRRPRIVFCRFFCHALWIWR